MSAVTTKPRAKSAPKQAARTPLQTMHATLAIAREKVTLAYDAAERGTPTDVLLLLVEEQLLPAAVSPLFRKALTKADVDEAYNAFFPVIAVIDGAIALASGTVIEHTLREAHALLGQVQNELDASEEIASGLPDIDVKARDFERGRDIAICMLDEADALMSEREGLRRYRRDGNAQSNLVKGYLSDIIEQPALIDGFTAVLSATIRNDRMDLSEVQKITLAETQAGEPGADGTEVVEDASPSSTAPDRSDQAPRTAAVRETDNPNVETLTDLLEQAKAIAFLLSHNFGGDGSFNGDPCDAPGIAGMVRCIALLLRNADGQAPVVAISEAAREAVSQAHALAAHLDAISRQDLCDGKQGFRIGDGILAMSYWTLELLVNRADKEVNL